MTGGFLVAVAALGVFVAARGAGQASTRDYVVVAHDVAAGTTLERGDLLFVGQTVVLPAVTPP